MAVNASPGAPQRPTWHTHYALAMLATIYVFNYIDRLVISILIEPIKAEFGISDTQIGLLSGVAFAIFYTLFGFPFGRLSDRIGRKPVIAIACIAWSGMTMLCGLATSFAMLLLFRIGVAVGEAGGTAPSVAMVSDLYPPEKRSRALSVFLMGPSLGAVLGLGLGGWIAQTYGWRTAFLVIGAPGVLLGLLLWLTVRNPAPPAPVTPAAGATKEKWTHTLRELLATPGFLLVVLAGTLAAVMGYAIGTWNPSFMIRSHDLSMQHAGLLVGLGGGLSATVGTLLCGSVTDRLVARDPGWQLGVPLIACLISVPLGLGFYLWPAGVAFHLGAIPIPEAYFFYLAFSFAATWWSVPCFGAISHLFPPNRLAQATAIFVMGMTLFGVGLGPIVVGSLSDFFAASIGKEALRYALASTVALYVLTALCLLAAIPAYRRRLGRAASRQGTAAAGA
ncbi:MFS transporter [Thauera sp.]|jgi:predicted MFS family arabinose efflux permease|uniref:spinster family MFS transporter n=1 Tax=Thauera sp. TaxID=1905334 RepID=UPI002A36FA60|nr:MFS transporter [Thauera sp.]MDX9887165.1 MFS transporter [Thauera sp.]